MYFTNGRAKVEIALAKGKNQYDKREAIKDREMKRDLSRALSDANAETQAFAGNADRRVPSQGEPDATARRSGHHPTVGAPTSERMRYDESAVGIAPPVSDDRPCG